MISGTHTINRSHQPCVDVTPPGPHHHTERVSKFKALILKTEHKQTLQSVVMLDCIEWILIGREDISHLG